MYIRPKSDNKKEQYKHLYSIHCHTATAVIFQTWQFHMNHQRHLWNKMICKLIVLYGTNC